MTFNYNFFGVWIMKSIIIDRLIEIEEEAKRISDRVYEERNELPKKIHERRSEIEKEYEDKYNSNLVEATRIIEAGGSIKIKEVFSEKTEKMDKMNSIFDDNHEIWENEIFSNIIAPFER